MIDHDLVRLLFLRLLLVSSHTSFPSTPVLSTALGLPTKKLKALRFQICSTRTKYLSEICKNRTTEIGAAKLFSVNSSWT